MLCPKCFQENDDNALFCKHCGKKLVKEEHVSDKLSNILLLAFAVTFFVTNVIQHLLVAFVDGWYHGWRVVYFLIGIVQMIACLLPAIAIKNKALKTGAIVLVAIPVLYGVYNNIRNMFIDF